MDSQLIEEGYFRLDSLVSVARFYKNKIKLVPLSEMTEPYEKVLILQFTDNGIVRITATLISPTRKEIKLLADKLHLSGYKRAEYKHEGKNYFVDLSKKPFLIQQEETK